MVSEIWLKILDFNKNTASQNRALLAIKYSIPMGYEKCTL